MEIPKVRAVGGTIFAVLVGVAAAAAIAGLVALVRPAGQVPPERADPAAPRSTAHPPDDEDRGEPDPQFMLECGWMNEPAASSSVDLRYDLAFRDPCLYNDDHEIPLACGDCGRAYLEFADHLPPWRVREIDAGTLDSMVRDPERFFGPRVTEPVARDTLADILTDALNSSWLLGEMNRAPIRVMVVDQTVTNDVCSQVFVIDDPWVGRFAGWWLMPRKVSHRVPTIVAVHGHGDSPIAFHERAFGERYPAAGFGLYLHAARGTCLNDREAEISGALLRRGYSFLALQVYEHDVVTRMLRGFAHVGGIGTLGHSGGAVATNVTAIVNPLVAAHAYDSYSTYVDFLPDGTFSHAMAPALWPWHPVINGNYEPGREPVPRDAPPRLRVPYDLQPRDVDLIVNFFAEHLR